MTNTSLAGVKRLTTAVYRIGHLIYNPQAINCETDNEATASCRSFFS